MPQGQTPFETAVLQHMTTVSEQLAIFAEQIDKFNRRLDNIQNRMTQLENEWNDECQDNTWVDPSHAEIPAQDPETWDSTDDIYADSRARWRSLAAETYPTDPNEPALAHSSWDSQLDNVPNKRTSGTAQLSSDEESGPMKALRMENERLKNLNTKQRYEFLELKQAVTDMRTESALLANSAAAQKSATNAPRNSSH